VKYVTLKRKTYMSLMIRDYVLDMMFSLESESC